MQKASLRRRIRDAILVVTFVAIVLIVYSVVMVAYGLNWAYCLVTGKPLPSPVLPEGVFR